MARRAPDLLIVALLIALPILWLNQVLVPGISGRTILPFDNLYSFEPWHSMRPDIVPYNPLVSDLVLESALWELQARRSVMAGELPLWNPQILAGAPLLADAQGSVLYPLDLALYWLPLAEAFAWYSAIHLALAGIGMYVFGRVLGLRRAAALLAAVAFMFSGNMITNATFPQVLGAAAWLPLLLAVVELIVQRTREGRSVAWLWFAGTAIVGLQFLAGHPEISAYDLFTAGAYGLARLLTGARRAPLPTLKASLCLLTMVGLGAALAAMQLLPTLEAVGNNGRLGVRSASDLAAVAWPLTQLWALPLPDLFGNPTHHAWLDIWHATWQAAPEPIYWGAKNYIEAGQYLGILTWLLALLGVLRGRRDLALIFGVLGLVSLLFVVGNPIYLALQGLPGFNQLRTPFRWVVPFAVSMCVLAGLGMDAFLAEPRSARKLALASGALGILCPRRGRR